MQAGDRLLDSFDVGYAGLDYKQNLRRGFDLAFPSVNRLH